MSLQNLLSGFKPNRKGLNKVLGELEAAVMEIIWQKRKASVRDVFEVLCLEREIAYTTVMTIMSRLAEKQLLTKKKQGLAFIYTPVHSKEDFTKTFVQEVIDGLLEDYSELTFSHFVGRIKEDDEAKIAMLEQVLQDKLHQGE